MISTRKGRHEEKEKIKKIKRSMVQKTVMVRIDQKTVIFIAKGEDPEIKKLEHIERLDRFRNNPNNF